MAEAGSETAPEDDAARVLEGIDFGLVLSSAGYGNVHVLSHEAGARALTANRRELIDVVADGDVQSISQLARRVGRDKGNVKRDLDVLADENLVAFETDGRRKRPVVKPDTIVQEPVVARPPESE